MGRAKGHYLLLFQDRLCQICFSQLLLAVKFSQGCREEEEEEGILFLLNSETKAYSQKNALKTPLQSFWYLLFSPENFNLQKLFEAFQVQHHKREL